MEAFSCLAFITCFTKKSGVKKKPDLFLCNGNLTGLMLINNLTFSDLTLLQDAGFPN